MRYIGNKESICNDIVEVLKRENLYKNDLVFFDAFCGSGSVADSLKNVFNIKINDNLKLATTYTAGRIVANSVDFSKLGFDPIDYFNSNRNTFDGFIFNNYAPKKSGRMYFSDFNAGRIDFFRKKIEEWYKDELIQIKEYHYLLACLLESVSKVANVAGVYGAYLKQWDPRAEKDIIFRKVESADGKANFPIIFNENIADIIADVECDILYLDPPYTKNKYTVQYHLLETLICNDNPKIKGITGGRDISYASTTWSIPDEVEVEFDKVIFKTKAKFILMSYSNDGIMSKNYILSVLKRYCFKESVKVFEIEYKKYRNHRTKKDEKHFEYIFFGTKKPVEEVIYCCPLNYMGGKSNLVGYITPHLSNRNKIIDIMGGGFNVGINAYNFEKYVYNDFNFIVAELIAMFKNEETSSLLKFIEKVIKKYGLEKHNKNTYLKLRQDYNLKYRFDSKNGPKYLYVLLLFGFQQMLRFNSNYEFNNPVGESGYSESVKEKVVSFSRRLKEIDLSIKSKDYEEFLDDLDEETLLYVDPPYLITLGSYNDGKRGFKGRNNNEEQRLLDFLDKAVVKKAKIVLSNILEYKGNTNYYLKEWISNNNCKVYNLVYRNRNEVLVVYDPKI